MEALFGDRFLYGKLGGVLLLLAGSCVYARFAGEERYPSFEACRREPARRAGSLVGIRAGRVRSADGTRATIALHGGAVPVHGPLGPEWVGRYLTAVCRFVPSESGGHLEVLTDAAGRPRMREEPDFGRRRFWMYGTSLAVVVLWVILFARAFEVRLPKGMIWPTS